MQVLQYVEAGRAELHDVDRPTPGPGEVLVKVTSVTTCPHWDLHLMAGEPMFPGHRLAYPYTAGQPGHEASGEVAAAGPGVDGLAPGTRVAAWRDPGHERPGCYAQYVVLDAANVLPVPADLPAEKVTSLELAMCVQVSFDQLAPLGAVAGKRVGITGLGPAGLVAVQLARAEGAREVVGIDPEPARRDLAERLGADRALPPASPDLPADRADAGAFDAAIDCTGLAPVVEDLVGRTREAVALFGVLREPVRFGFGEWAGGVALLGYRPHNRAAAERALGHIVAGRLDLAPLVSVSLPLARYAEGVSLLRRKAALKVRFLPWES